MDHPANNGSDSDLEGPVQVCEIKDVSPIANLLKLHGKIVDDEDVRERTPEGISLLLAKRAGNAKRKLIILREGNDGVALLLVPKERTVAAPPGRLGIVMEAHPEGGPAFICEIKNVCPIGDLVRLDDHIIAIDDEDVRDVTPENISMLPSLRAWSERMIRS